MGTSILPMAALAEGESTMVRVGGEQILVSCVYGQYYAVSGVCTHAAQSLATGRLKEYEVICPLHGARFDVRTGACTKGPAVNGLKHFPVYLEGGKVCLDI